LLVITKQLTEKIREELQNDIDTIEVEFGMRYGSPSLESAVDLLIEKGCSKILLFPMYPQYSATTTAATYDVVFAHLLKRRWVPTLRVAEPYYAHPAFIQALAATIDEAYTSYDKRPEKLVLSYHGIPYEYIKKGDPYCCMCAETTQALLPAVSLAPSEIIHTYQSRFGRDPWLEPYTDQTIDGLAERGVKHIAVACPGFTADCLETLDEIGNEARHAFSEKGGERLDLIPCLNTHPRWISAMKELVYSEISSWLETRKKTSSVNCKISCPTRKSPFEDLSQQQIESAKSANG
jgi:ferrochelatase